MGISRLALYWIRDVPEGWIGLLNRKQQAYPVEMENGAIRDHSRQIGHHAKYHSYSLVRMSIHGKRRILHKILNFWVEVYHGATILPYYEQKFDLNFITTDRKINFSLKILYLLQL